MNARELRVGRTYAYPTTPGPWHRVAVPARVMSHGPRNHVLVLLPHGIPAAATRDEVPRAALVWIDAAALVSTWDEWPARAASARADMAAVVSSAVAAIGGAGAPTIEGPHDADEPPTRWWSRPVQQLLRPPALPVTSGSPPVR